jgi:hypothetical protein
MVNLRLPGFVELDAVANDDADLLREALEISDPGEAIG